MSDLDREPTPPSEDPPGGMPTPPPGFDVQGFPLKPFPYQVVATAWQWLQVGPPEQRRFAQILDTFDVRHVTFWSEDDVRRIIARLQEMIGVPQLTVADVDDLRRLRDASPFEGR